MMDEDEDERRRRRAERLAAHKPYNMKSLGRLVDSNRLTGVARPEPTTPDLPRRSRQARPAPEPPDDVVDPDETDESIGDESPSGRVVESNTEPAGQVDEAAVQVSDVDGVDRSEMGVAVTRSGLASRLETAAPLARRMLEEEIAPGGRISDPQDVAGIVLDLAKDIPASVAVSVVKMDEEVEVVGDTVDPSIDANLFSAVFSNVIRTVRPAAELLENGPLGAIQDVVVEGEHLDLILRPLGDRYYLMVLENRHDTNADLGLARLRMASIAPAVAALLAQQDGEV